MARTPEVPSEDRSNDVTRIRNRNSEDDIRKALEPIPEQLIPAIAEIAARRDAINAARDRHLNSFAQSVEREHSASDEYLRSNGLMPLFFSALLDTLADAERTAEGKDVPTRASELMRGEAISTMLESTSLALRDPAVIDQLGRFMAAEILLRALDAKK